MSLFAQTTHCADQRHDFGGDDIGPIGPDASKHFFNRERKGGQGRERQDDSVREGGRE